MLATSFIGKMNNCPVDYVLVSTLPLSEPHPHHPNYQVLKEKMKKRRVFLNNLKQEGLKIKTVQLKESNLLFDIISVPMKVLERYY